MVQSIIVPNSYYDLFYCLTILSTVINLISPHYVISLYSIYRVFFLLCTIASLHSKCMSRVES